MIIEQFVRIVAEQKEELFIEDYSIFCSRPEEMQLSLTTILLRNAQIKFSDLSNNVILCNFRAWVLL